jgi:hypothetical protein
MYEDKVQAVQCNNDIFDSWCLNVTPDMKRWLFLKGLKIYFKKSTALKDQMLAENMFYYIKKTIRMMISLAVAKNIPGM